MDAKYIVANIATAIQQKSFPTVVLWNRLEGRPRTHDFDRALKAEVRDALWMLTKQWQMGEFNGDDAGSPVFAKAHIATTSITKYKAGGHEVQSYDQHVPFETKVEQRKVIFERNGKPISFDLRLQMGKRWLKLASALSNLSSQFIKLYSFEMPEKNRASYDVYAHAETWQQYAAVSGRCMDGYKLFQYLKADPAHKASDRLSPVLSGSDKTTIDDSGNAFLLWFDRLYFQPADPKDDAWKPNNLEYSFECSAPSGENEKVLTAEEYYSGHLDWYSFNADQSINKLDDIAGVPQPGVQKTFTNTFIPANVQFEGMPNRRWWAFEDSKTSFGDVNPSTTDIAKLLLIEFGLVYGNDWFLVPFSIPTGTISNIEGLSVTNNFGERFWIEAAGKNTGNNINDWSMYTLDGKIQFNRLQKNTGLLLAPAAIKVMEGDPIEDVRLIRDEMANMVWGIEAVVPIVTGQGRSGKDEGQEVLSYHKKLVEDKLRLIKEATLLLQDLNALAGSLPVPLAEAKTTLENLIAAANVPDPDIEGGQKNIGEAKTKMESVGMNTIHRIDIGDMEVPYMANISYLAMTTVPEHWIPFVPVHIKEDDNREIQLQRASMLRIIEGDSVKPEKIKPLTSLMREGLDEEPKQPYYVHEEEVPRAGAQVTEAFQRTRWTCGEVFVWLGNQKKTGRGEGSSGLAFDQIVNVKPGGKQ